MYCANTIRVRTERERMFALAADVERWPTLLPHYRWVRVLRRAGASAYLDMAARRAPGALASRAGRLPRRGADYLPARRRYHPWDARSLADRAGRCARRGDD